MFEKIIPKIISGKKRFVLSESICFLFDDGVEIQLPINSGENTKKYITFQFIFKENKQTTEPAMEKISSKDGVLVIALINFHNPGGAGTIKTIPFTVGEEKYYLLFYCNCLSSPKEPQNKLITMTISIYTES
jgi:hypothetical protein